MMRLHLRFSLRHPYAWRTNLRVLLPRPICWWIPKGKDCESHGAKHAWYNQDGEKSACYHCEVIHEGQRWRNDLPEQ